MERFVENPDFLQELFLEEAWKNVDKIDGFIESKANAEEFEVTAEELRAAWDCVDGNFRETLRQAADNIRHFHEAQVHRDFCLTDRPGVVLGQRYTPVERVGICVPGSPVAFPSTILMNVIPARIAGVKEIAVVTPPNQNGAISAEALAAVKIAGADRVFKIGGAQAVAALAYGTETVPQVDKIVGPGGVFVAAAKRKVFGQVDIDMIKIHNVKMGGFFTLPATADGTGSWAVGDWPESSTGGGFITVVQGKSIEVNSNTTATDISEKTPMLNIPQKLTAWKVSEEATNTKIKADGAHQCYLSITCKIQQSGGYLLGSADSYGTIYVPFGDTWVAGKRHIYTLIFGGGYTDQGEAVLNPIQFDAETTGWVDADKDVNVQP